MILDKDGNKYYKIALHLHSTLSDGKRTPEEIAEIYKAHGYDAIAFTDHWIYGDSKELCGLHIISGCEYNYGVSNTENGGVMHIVGLGMKCDPKTKRDATQQEIIDNIRNCGGMAVLAHPAWSLNTVEDYKALSGLEATEIYNAVSEQGQSLRPDSSYFVDLLANEGHFPKILATDDSHYYGDVDNCKGWIFAKCDEPSDEAILAAIRSGDTFASMGPELFAKQEGNKIIIDTTPCSIIGILSNLSWAHGHVLRGEDLTHFEYEIKDNERWVRVEVSDKDGKRAWSNVYVK